MIQHEIKIQPNCNNIQIKLYRTSQCKKIEIEKQIKQLKEANMIIDSYSNYASPVILVKKNGTKKRFCVDYRALNQITIKNEYLIPRIDDTLENLKKSKIFSKIDLKTVYWQVPIKEEDKFLTAFRSYYGLYEWNFMPFGLTNAPAMFQRLMNSIL